MPTIPTIKISNRFPHQGNAERYARELAILDAELCENGLGQATLAVNSNYDLENLVEAVADFLIARFAQPPGILGPVVYNSPARMCAD